MLDNLLVRRAKKGNKEALLKLIMAEKDSYYGLAYSYMKTEEDAMNILQDTIVKLYENIGGLKDLDKFYSWSKTILVNLCKTELKKRERIVLLADLREQIEEEDKDENLILEEILGSLDEKYRDVIRLKFILGYDIRTMAEILEIPEGTVKSRIHKAKIILRENLGEVEEDEGSI